MMELARGTTPSYTVDFSTCEINTNDISRAVLKVKQMGVERDLRDGIVIDNVNNKITYHFTQEETLSFVVGKMRLQLDVVTDDEERYVASRDVVNVVDTLIDEVI